MAALSVLNQRPHSVNLETCFQHLSNEDQAKVRSALTSFVQPGDAAASTSLVALFQRYLCEVGVQASSREHPFVKAVQRKDQRIMDLFLALVDKGFNVNSQSSLDRTAAHQAVLSGDLELLKRLRDFGLDLEVTDAFENRPIHLAASSGNEDMVRYLISEGVDVDAVNQGGLTAFEIANAEFFSEVRDALLEGGARQPLY